MSAAHALGGGGSLASARTSKAGKTTTGSTKAGRKALDLAVARVRKSRGGGGRCSQRAGSGKRKT